MTRINKYNTRYIYPNRNPRWDEINNNSKRLSPSSQFYLYKGKVYWGPPIIAGFEIMPKKYDDYKNAVKRFKEAGLWEDETTSKTKNLQTYTMTLCNFMPEMTMKQELEIHNRGITKITINEINTIEIKPNVEIVYFVRINGKDAKVIAEEFQNKEWENIENCILTIQNTQGTFEIKCETGKNGISNPLELHYSYWLNIHVNLQDYQIVKNQANTKYSLLDI